MNNPNLLTVEILGHKHIKLPGWIDDLIFNNYGAEYNPQPQIVQYTPNNPDFDKTYLGTYFPRSFVEAYCIMDQLLKNEKYYDALVDESELNILDFCCGTAGELLGLILILQEKLPNLKRIHIDAFDANEMYVFNIFHIIENLSEHLSIDIGINPQCIFVENEQHLDDIINTTNKKYHIALSFKAMNEFIRGKTFPNDNVYKKVAEKLLPLITDNGILILSDLTYKCKEEGFYYPEKMNEGLNSLLGANTSYKSIYPFPCYHYEYKCKGCYMQDIIYVTHSHKIMDISKVAYRIIGKSHLATQIVSSIKPNICREVNNWADKNSPYNHNL